MSKFRHVVDEDDPRVARFGHAAPAWLMNYADLMTELVILFIVLYAVSASLNKKLQKAKIEIQQTMADQKIEGEIKVDREGLRITLEEAGQGAFFESGKAEITPRMTRILGKLAPTLRNLVAQGQQIVVEGHTDNIPIHSRQFESNWELSTARATSVVRTLTQEYALPPEPLAAIGYGEFRPVTGNDTPSNRSRNRRVVFFIKAVPAAKKAVADKILATETPVKITETKAGPPIPVP